MSELIPASRPPRILIADDDTTTRLFVEHSLAAEGFDVVHAADGPRALEVFDREKPDIVLLDVMMPGKDGFEVCSEIRRLPWGRLVPVLMLTGLEDHDALARAFAVGATDFATKPLSAGMLAHRVRYMLRASETIDELRKSEARLAAAQEIARMGHWEWDREEDLLALSGQAARLLGLDPARAPFRFADYVDRIVPADAGRLEEAIALLLESGRPLSLDHRIPAGSGKFRSLHVEASIAPVTGGRPGRLLGVLQDVTERVETEARIRALAYYDSLTGLPNRVMFGDLLRSAIARAIRQKHHVAAMFLDLDNFKRINDTMGHAAGDQLLAQVAKRLRKVVREHDPLGREVEGASPLSVARLGGDEFLMALTDLVRPDDAGRVATRIVESLNAPFAIAETELFVSASIGISIFPNDGTDVDELLKNADTALYHAKDLGRNTFVFYDASMNRAALERLLLEGQIRRALERHEFVLYFQPQIDTAANRVIGAEALLRWKHPDMGLISPHHFIGILEHTGLILSVGEWVLREACRQLREWHDAGLTGIGICVNLSAMQFRHPRVLDSIVDIVRKAGVDPMSVELEVTESAMVDSGPEALRLIESLRQKGFRVSMDDFGTGYSSLSYLRRFPVDRLKIDRSFVREAVMNPRDAAIVATIISLARTLGIEPFGEGVELDAQRELLAACGCTLMQGNLFGRPVPPEEFARLVRGEAMLEPAALSA
jgi:diguanylate cyclase (GGDEF)-like protein/PAS domain S-box-containing protein